MSVVTDPWNVSAARRVRQALGPARSAPWLRGAWLTARERYDEVPIPTGFEVEIRKLGDTWRRLATHPGAGRPLLILPGSYATLHERLFVRIAAAAAETGRPVILLEDRLAAPTVRIAGSQGLGPRALGRGLAELARSLPQAPDVLALSGGLMAAWSADPDALHRVVGFSGIRHPSAAAGALAGHPLLYRHFAGCHRRSGLTFPFDELIGSLGRIQPLAAPEVPWLLVHADDDPVVPPWSLHDLEPSRVCRVPAGGHLGFGILAGSRVYLLPFEADDD